MLGVTVRIEAMLLILYPFYYEEPISATLFRLFWYYNPGNNIGNHSNTNGEKGEYHPEDPDQVRISIVILSDSSANPSKESLRF